MPGMLALPPPTAAYSDTQGNPSPFGRELIGDTSLVAKAGQLEPATTSGIAICSAPGRELIGDSFLRLSDTGLELSAENFPALAREFAAERLSAARQSAADGAFEDAKFIDSLKAVNETTVRSAAK